MHTLSDALRFREAIIAERRAERAAFVSAPVARPSAPRRIVSGDWMRRLGASFIRRRAKA